MDKAEYQRRWRARKAIEAGREPGRIGRPPTGRKQRTPEQRRAERERARRLERERQASYPGRRAKVYRWREENRDRYLAYRREWYAKLDEERRAIQKAKNVEARRIRKQMEVLRMAEEIVSDMVSRDRRMVLVDPLFEDACGVAIVALMSRRNRPIAERVSQARTDVMMFVRAERSWRRRIAPLFPDAIHGERS